MGCAGREAAANRLYLFGCHRQPGARPQLRAISSISQTNNRTQLRKQLADAERSTCRYHSRVCGWLWPHSDLRVIRFHKAHPLSPSFQFEWNIENMPDRPFELGRTFGVSLSLRLTARAFKVQSPGLHPPQCLGGGPRQIYSAP